MPWKVSDDYDTITNLDDPDDFITVTQEGKVLLILVNAIMNYTALMDDKINNMDNRIRELEGRLYLAKDSDNATTKH